MNAQMQNRCNFQGVKQQRIRGGGADPRPQLLFKLDAHFEGPQVL